MANVQGVQQITDVDLILQVGGIAIEAIRAGDYCRIVDGNRVRLLRDGDSLRMTDCMATHDAKAVEAVQVVVGRSGSRRTVSGAGED